MQLPEISCFDPFNHFVGPIKVGVLGQNRVYNELWKSEGFSLSLSK